MSGATVIVLAITAWAATILGVLSIARAGRGDDAVAFERAAPPAEPAPVTRLERRITLAQYALLLAALAVAALVSREADWRPLELVALLTVLAVVSDLLALEARRFRVSGSFTALVLAMALVGPAPAVAIGVLCALADGLRHRHRASDLASNLATYAIFTLAGGLLLDLLSDPGAAEQAGGAYPALVFAVCIPLNLLNFTLIAGHAAVLGRVSLRDALRRVYLPVLPWELSAAVVAAGAVWAHQRWGLVAIGLFAVALGVYQLLLRSLLAGQQHGELLTRQVEEIGVRHERMLGLMLRTLSLRDPTAARHAAAVAHYSLEVARAGGLGALEQQVAHTAGLLHDIGKQAFPDSILIAERELDGADRRLIQRHAADGARLVREVPGLEPVADAVLAHHERPDGQGYPRGLRGDAIPLAARVVAVAEVYDALTAPDSYRRPVTVEEAVAELRRVAGAQLDAGLVEAFARMIEHEGAEGFRHQGDADLEVELRRQRFSRNLIETKPLAR